MKKIFINYHHTSKTQVSSLASDINSLGYQVWLDEELSGGQNWWNRIIESIRECDIFIYAISQKSIEAMSCKILHNYAKQLNKNIIFIIVNGSGVSLNLLTSEVTQNNLIDYQNQSRETILILAKMLLQITPTKPLPVPLPDPPDIPLSYFSSIAKKIEDDSPLNFELQSSLIIQIKKSISASPSPETFALLKKFRERNDLFATIADEIDELLCKKNSLIVSVFKNKKFQLILLVFFISFFVAMLNLNYSTIIKHKVNSNIVPEWFTNSVRFGDAITAIGTAKDKRIEVAIKKADYFARKQLLSQIDQKKIKDLHGCFIAKRHISPDGRVFSMVVMPKRKVVMPKRKYKLNNKVLYNEFKAKQAFDELQKEIDSLNFSD